MEEKVNQILYKNNIIQPLKGFCTVIEEGNITKATQKLHLTEGTISKQIQSLERELGFDLFIRKRNFMQPTEKALRFYEIAIARLNDIENLFKEFLDNENEISNNTIRIAAHYGVITEILPKLIKKYSNENDKISFEINNINREKALNMLENNMLDIAIYSRTDYSKNLNFTKLFESKPILIISKNNLLAKKNDIEITLKDIENSSFINLNENMIYDFFKKELKRDEQYKTKIKLIDSNWSILLKLVENDIGISGIFDFYNAKQNKNVICKDISHILPNLTIDIITKKTNFQKQSIIKFISMLKEEFSQKTK